mgnify:CR=1 FL=1
MRAYVRSLSFILCKAVHELYEGVELRIEHPISKGYYCKLLGLNREVTEQDVENIKQKMYRTIEQDIPFLMKSVPSDEAINYFEKKKAYDVSKLLQSLGQFYTKIYELDGEWDRFLGPLVPSTGLNYIMMDCFCKFPTESLRIDWKISSIKKSCSILSANILSGMELWA